MSKFKAKIIDIEAVDVLHIVSFDFNGVRLQMLSLDLKDDIIIGTEVLLSVKASNVALAKNSSAMLSFSNQLKATITSCEHGKLLTQVDLVIGDVSFESIVTKEKAIEMDLKIDDEVTILIQASELSILERLDD
jgi:molybdopterin-binding protein